MLYSRQLLEVLVEQFKKWQVEQTDPGLLVLKHILMIDEFNDLHTLLTLEIKLDACHHMFVIMW